MLLPSQNSLRGVAAQGWKIATRVGPSAIAGAGNGRFALEAAAQGTRLSSKPIISMSSIESLATIRADNVLAFERKQDLDKYIKLNVDGGHSRQSVLEVIEHFVWSLDGQRACLCASTWSMNHADENTSNVLNVHKAIVDNAVVGEALIDIAEGDELCNNYRDFLMPDFYTAFCAEHGFLDVQSAVLAAIEGTTRSRTSSDVTEHTATHYTGRAK